MPRYILQGYTTGGAIVTIDRTFRDERSAYAAARNERLTVFAVERVADATTSTTPPYVKEKAVLYRELALYLTKGVPKEQRTAELLELAEPQTPWYAVLAGFLAALERRTLAAAMDGQPRAFATFERNLLRNATGEDQVGILLRLADYYDRIADTRGGISKALRGPALQIVGILAIMLIYMFSVVPAMRSLQDGENNPLPLPFQVLGAASDWLHAPLHGALVLAVLVLLIALLNAALRTRRGARIFDAVLVYNPVLPIWRTERQAFAAYVLELMMRSGEQREALAVARDAAVGPIFQDQLAVAHDINVGRTLTPDGKKRRTWVDALAYAPVVFTRRSRTLLRIAEAHGDLPEELGNLAALLNADLKRQLADLPGKVNAISTGVTIGFILLILFVFILPFSGYIATFK